MTQGQDVHDLARMVLAGEITADEYWARVQELLATASQVASSEPQSAEPAADERLRSAEASIDQYLKRLGALLSTAAEEAAAEEATSEDSAMVEERIRSTAKRARSFS